MYSQKYLYCNYNAAVEIVLFGKKDICSVNIPEDIYILDQMDILHRL